ncbi:MAG: multidrug efflux MFS transporter [Lentisphaerae bacterium]|nr:multidrug efflux MFS transporter [Lentisphaerota bacterium]
MFVDMCRRGDGGDQSEFDARSGIFFRFIAVFAGSGLDPALQIWLSRRTSAENRGLIFGYAASMRSCGNFLSPLVAGLVVSSCGVRGLYVFGPVFFLLMAYALYRVTKSNS